jgi:uncharacterized protein YbbK (DUF523 family)
MKKVAISACLLGNKCRYDASDNYTPELLEKLEGCELVAFCPEDFAFGSPRPTMDLVQTTRGVRAISNLSGADLSPPVREYAKAFFDTHSDIKLFIGKDRSPSCGVRSARLYDRDEAKTLITDRAAGLMAKEALARGIEAWDAEEYVTNRTS